jgi:hypothetical protein
MLPLVGKLLAFSWGQAMQGQTERWMRLAEMDGQSLGPVPPPRPLRRISKAYQL